MSGSPSGTRENVFLDLTGEEWYAKAVLWAQENGTKIDPQGNTARAECALIILRFMNNR